MTFTATHRVVVAAATAAIMTIGFTLGRSNGSEGQMLSIASVSYDCTKRQKCSTGSGDAASGADTNPNAQDSDT